MENFFDNNNLLRILAKWKWHLLIIAVLAALVSLIFSSSMVMKPRFKSTAVIYPSNVAPYSDESETEQMLQWINSKDVKDSVMRKFDLAKHYGIDSSYKYFSSTMSYLYDKFVKVAKTPFESVEITVIDRDPVFARDMVNAIIHYTDLKIRATHHSKYVEVVESLKKALVVKQQEIDSTKALLNAHGGAGNFLSKSAETMGIIGAQGQASAPATKGDGDLIYLTYRMFGLANEFDLIMQKYDLAVFDAKKEFTYINVVTPPQVADKKSYPKRLLVMLYFVAGALLLSLVAISFVEQKKSTGVQK
ncbi:MAG TPA: Wzz/FepE/Etk N-terminal domain-containing protein [Bacteroidales bacterium]|jgi:uncharacterized protein involved in exopolysaccharide biosynthesis|nr:Wzz/FepE/Etk N-terminal domain-containing protein [Bacteroidales bacterium]